MMSLKKGFGVSAYAFAFLLSIVCAQESAQTNLDATVVGEAVPQEEKEFWLLVRVNSIRGTCEVYNPDVDKFMAAIENKAYPLGSVVRTGAGSSAALSFSELESLQLSENTEVVALCAEQNKDARVVRLVKGKIRTNLRENLKAGLFGVETANASCKDVAGRGEYSVLADAKTETFQVATITGANRIEGAHYKIPALRAANTLNVMTAVDRSLSRLTSVSGDFAIMLDKGSEEPVSYQMSPQAVVKIWRENAPVGGRAVIATLVVSPNGMAQHRFAYAEGRENIATGELIEPTIEIDDLPKHFAPAAAEPKVSEAPANKESSAL